MAYSAVLNATSALRGASGTTAIEGVRRFQLQWDENVKTSRRADDVVVRDRIPVGVTNLRCVLEVESFTEVLTNTLLATKAQEVFKVKFDDEAGEKTITFSKARIESGGSFEFPDRETRDVPTYALTAWAVLPSDGAALSAVLSIA